MEDYTEEEEGVEQEEWILHLTLEQAEMEEMESLLL